MIQISDILRFITSLASNPLFILYVGAATTYAVAAALSLSSRHKGMSACYAANSLVHGLLGACHLLHLG
jgi:hypothetical protein